jgi:hypothetical protein
METSSTDEISSSSFFRDDQKYDDKSRSHFTHNKRDNTTSNFAESSLINRLNDDDYGKTVYHRERGDRRHTRGTSSNARRFYIYLVDPYGKFLRSDDAHPSSTAIVRW